MLNYLQKLLIIIIVFITPFANISLKAMDDDDSRGTLIKYLKNNHPEAFYKLNQNLVEDKFVNYTLNWVTSPFNKLRPVNSDDILFTAVQAHVLGMTHALFHYAENAIYNLTLKHSKNTVDVLVDIFLNSNMSKEKLFTSLLDPDNLKRLLFNKLRADALKEDKPYNSSDLPFWLKGGLFAFQRLIFKESPEDHVSWMKEKATAFTEEYLIGPNRQAFSLEEMKKTALVKVNEMIINSMKIDQEAENKNFPVFSTIIAPIFWKKGCESSKALILSLLHPIAHKLHVKSEDLLKEPEIPDSKQEKNWEEIIDPMKKAYEVINSVIPAKTAQVVKKNDETNCNDNCFPHNNEEAAIKGCCSEANKGNAANPYILGSLSYHAWKDSTKAKADFEEASRQGDIRAHAALKELYNCSPPPPPIAPTKEKLKRFMIVSENSKKALDSWGDSWPWFDDVGKYKKHKKGHKHYKRQIWGIGPAEEDNQYCIIYSTDCRKVLSSCGNDNDHVGKFVLHHPDTKNRGRHLWKITPVGNNCYTIVSMASKKALSSCGKNNNHICKASVHSSGHPNYSRHLWRIEEGQ